MAFNSLHFLIFFAIVLLLYYVLPHKCRWVLLLMASYYAYMCWNVALSLLIVGTTVVSYVSARIMEKTSNKALKKLCLVVTLVICLGVLVLFKYADFLLHSAASVLNFFGAQVPTVSLNLLLPIGISFYTFQTLSYVIDVYRGMPAEKHFGYYALFVSFFPQLVAGPIERPQNLIPQLKAHHKINNENMIVGLRYMLSGFFRKCVVADFCGVFVTNVFSNYQSANALAIVLGAWLFCVQVYCDFAGYSEIAIGCARMMGIKLSKNFDCPYAQLTMTGLMSRWHMTLMSWFRDYVYIPLGGNRKGTARRVLNLFIVYFLSGLWHGANWTYVLWGLYVCCVVSIEALLKNPFSRLQEKFKLNNLFFNTMRRVLLFFAMIPSAVFFRSPSVEDAFQMLGRVFTQMDFGKQCLANTVALLNISSADVALLVVCFAVLLLLNKFTSETVQRDFVCLQQKTAYWQRVWVYIYFILAVAFGWLMLLGSGNVSGFVYFQF